MKDSHQKELAALLQKAQNGDHAALQSLCKELEKYIRQFFKLKFQDINVIDDLCQETHIKLLNNLSSIREGLKLKGFVTKVAFHTMQDYLRQKYRKQEESLENEFDNDSNQRDKVPETSTEYNEDDNLLNRLDLEKALNRLPEKSKNILEMKSNGFSYEEIADKTDLSVSGVKMQVKRSIEQLKFSLFIVTFLSILTTTLLEKLIE